ncbi:hypothetical protein ACWDHH_11040 [Janibacter hoylei]|uniref:hypothetical protein n=1 Tax=Janibacter hoylei TaxID=364298 RepID=UPI00367A5C2F
MDPLRGLIHLGLKVTETTLDRALDVVRLADTLLVTTATTPTSDRETVESVWPEEEQADLDALSSTLRARDEGGAGAATKAPSKKAAAKKVPAKKTVAKKAPAKTATKKAPTKTATKKTVTRKTPAKKASAKKAPVKKTAATPEVDPGA